MSSQTSLTLFSPLDKYLVTAIAVAIPCLTVPFSPEVIRVYLEGALENA